MLSSFPAMSVRLVANALFLGLLGSTGVMATPETPPAIAETNAVLDQFREDGNHLQAIDALRALAEEYSDSRTDMHAVSQRLGTQASWLGNEREALNAFTRHLFGNRLPPGDLAPIPGDARAQALREAISTLTEGHKLVLINEAHHVSRHRATTRSLLASLHDAGFRYLALEALYEPGDALAARGYPVSESGNYLKDPVFGDLAREALRLGFKLVRYEPENERNQEERETKQAEAIAAVLERDAGARVLVHAGYQHIEESGLLFGARTMAQHLEQLTGIDPLTLNQTRLTWIGDSMEPNAVYSKAIEQAPQIREAFVLQGSDRTWSLQPEKYDISVITPPTVYTASGRPGWLKEVGARQVVTLDVPEGSRLAEARLENEPDEAVPVDRIEVRSGEHASLLLPAATYRLNWFDANGKALGSDPLHVKND